MMKVLLAVAIFGAVLAATPANATHDTIYSPCSTEYGYIHMTYDEWAAHITTMEADGTIPPGIVFRYYEALHGGKGGTVLEDGTIPAWDTWAYNLEDGMILSIDDWANGNYPEIEELMFASGKVPEWILDANRVIRRFDDPYWGVANPMTPTFTVWQSLCMGDYGYSIPVMEINDDGVWVSNLPATTTTTTVVPTTTTVLTGSTSDPTPNPETTPSTTTTVLAATTSGPTSNQDASPSTTTQAIIGTTPTADPPVTTTTQAITVTTTLEVTPEPSLPALQATPNSLPAGYDLWTAQYEGWPFYETIILLEERYPQGTPGKYHFRLSTAVEFLRADGMIAQLDSVWNSNGG